MDREYNDYNIYNFAGILLIALMFFRSNIHSAKVSIVVIDNADSEQFSNIVEILLFKTRVAAVHAD
jgi:hypothetical protein